MHTIITQPSLPAGVRPDTAARQRRERLDRARGEELEAALAFLSVIDPVAFELALTAVPRSDEDSAEDEEPAPVCRRCGRQVGIFPEHGLGWQHFRGSPDTFGTHDIYEPDHDPEVTWSLPDDSPDDL